MRRRLTDKELECAARVISLVAEIVNARITGDTARLSYATNQLAGYGVAIHIPDDFPEGGAE